jgi:hypothetical protein
MMGKEAKYVVRLSGAERQELTTVVATGRRAETVLRARVFLKADVGVEGPGWLDTKIADAFEISVSKVHRLRQPRRSATRRACALPVSLSGMSARPRNRCVLFQSVSPCRTKMYRVAGTFAGLTGPPAGFAIVLAIVTGSFGRSVYGGRVGQREEDR